MRTLQLERYARELRRSGRLDGRIACLVISVDQRVFGLRRRIPARRVKQARMEKQHISWIQRHRLRRF